MRQKNDWLAASGQPIFSWQWHRVPRSPLKLRGQVMVFAALWTCNDKVTNANAYEVFTMNLKSCTAFTGQIKKHVQVLFSLVHV